MSVAFDNDAFGTRRSRGRGWGNRRCAYERKKRVVKKRREKKKGFFFFFLKREIEKKKKKRTRCTPDVDVDLAGAAAAAANANPHTRARARARSRRLFTFPFPGDGPQRRDPTFLRDRRGRVIFRRRRRLRVLPKRVLLRSATAVRPARNRFNTLATVRRSSCRRSRPLQRLIIIFVPFFIRFLFVFAIRIFGAPSRRQTRATSPVPEQKFLNRKYIKQTTSDVVVIFFAGRLSKYSVP